MNGQLPPALLAPPPRHPSGMKGLFESRGSLALGLLGGIWGFIALLVGLIALRGYLKYGEADLVVAGAIGGFLGVLFTIVVGVGLLMASGRAQRIYTHGLVAAGRVRAVVPNPQAPDGPAGVEIDFQDAWGRPGMGSVNVKRERAHWLGPGVQVPVLYHPHEAGLFAAYVEGVGVVLGFRQR